MKSSRKTSLALILISALGGLITHLFLDLNQVKTLKHAPITTPTPPPPPEPIHLQISLRNLRPEQAPPQSPEPDNSPRESKVPEYYKRKPQGNRVEFKVVDGLAVTHGDLVLGKPSPENRSKKGFFDAPPPQLWDRPDIPYAISKDLPNPDRIEKALAYLRENTPIRFIPYSGQIDAVLFQPGTEHCLSPLGKLGGIQPIYLSSECQMTEVLHEIMHTLGFVHEQSRTDRDQYVEILWDNIDPDFQGQFAIVPDSYMAALKDSPFDYSSVMLYPSQAFALSPNLPSMISAGNQSISPTTQGLSDTDIKRLYRLYNL